MVTNVMTEIWKPKNKNTMKQMSKEKWNTEYWTEELWNIFLHMAKGQWTERFTPLCRTDISYSICSLYF